MDYPLWMLFGSLVLLQFKHFLFDFVFQTAYQLKNKGTYGHPGGILHAGLHALGSLPAILILGPSAAMVAALAIAEFFVHYHVDWLKERVVRTNGWTTSDDAFWHAIGVDQFVHHLTYTLMLAVLASA